MKTVTLLLMLLVAGCTSQKSDGLQISIINGLEIRMNTTEPGEGRFDANLKVELSIGDNATKENYILDSPKNLLVDDSGNMYYLEWKSARIKSYSPGGRFLRQVAAKGQGPGELDTPAYLAWTPDGHIAILDGRNLRITIIDTLGKYICDHRVQGYKENLQIDPLGGFWYACDKIPADYEMTGNFTIVTYDRFIARKNKLGEDPTIFGPFIGSRHMMKASPGGGIITMGARNWPTTTWLIGAQGQFISGYNADYMLTVHDSTGIPLYAFGRHYLQTSNPNSDKMGQTEWLPAFYDKMIFDKDGHLWLRIYTDDETTYVYDVFSLKGHYLRQVFANEPIHLFHNGSVYGITRNNEDEPIIRRYKMSMLPRE
ncbi:hypothetical protein KAR48_09215 [bacterium]|nr:hypothetical protein [bacterium]